MRIYFVCTRRPAAPHKGFHEYLNKLEGSGLQNDSAASGKWAQETRREEKYFGLDCGLVILHGETCVAFCGPCTNGDV